jgi:hypothetical protein
LIRIIPIDKALYEVDEDTKTYRFYSRNTNWEKLSKEENERNKKSIDGYCRIFRDGTRKKFKYSY